MPSQPSPGTAHTDRRHPSRLHSPLDLFSRSMQLVFGRAENDDAETLKPVAKIQPVVSTLYPAEAPPEPPKPLAPALRLDPPTKVLLQSLARESSPNAELARSLLECESPPMTPVAVARYRGVVQRLTLVARMIASIEADPHVPDSFKQAFERLRFTLIKSALADANFLAYRGHPLRASAAELVMRAATSAHQDVTVERELASALDNAVRDFDLSANFVRPVLIRMQPLSLETVRTFLEQLQAERDEREAVARGRQRTEREIAARLQGAVLDPRLRLVIAQEWKAVLNWRQAKWGVDSPQWREGLAIAEALLQAAPALQRGTSLPQSLRESIELGLAEAGRPVEPVLEVLAALGKALPLSLQATTGRVTVRPHSLGLARLMDGSRWFRVFDHSQQKMRWMKSSSYDPVNDVVIFTELDGDTPLQLQAAQFLEDLKRGLSAPNQPDEATNELVSELRAAA